MKTLFHSFRHKLLLSITFTLLMIMGCDHSSSPDNQNSSSSSESAYHIDTIKVDYKSTTDHMVAYLDFSTAKITHVPYDVWDIAISTNHAEVISNGGIWGTGVRMYKTTSSKIKDDFSSLKDSILQIVDTNSNPFIDAFDNNGTGSESVYLIQDASGNQFKVQFTLYGPMGKYQIKLVHHLDGTEIVELNGSINADKSHTFLDLSTEKDVSNQIPDQDTWDVQFGRGVEFQMGSTLSAKSVITFNTFAGVQVAVVEKQSIDQVESISSLDFSSNRLLIGSSWYAFDHETKEYTVNTTTYVFKTTEEHYAKLQLRSFYGPNQEQFWSIIKFAYQDNESTTFAQ